jgi:hypothetical protein
MRDHLRSQHGDLLVTIVAEKALSDETQDKLRAAIGEYLRSFSPEVAAASVTETAS